MEVYIKQGLLPIIILLCWENTSSTGKCVQDLCAWGAHEGFRDWPVEFLQRPIGLHKGGGVEQLTVYIYVYICMSIGA